MTESQSHITTLLGQASAGNASAQEELYAAVCEELLQIARGYMHRERNDHTLEPTCLVNDAFMRLLGRAENSNWEDRKHFYRHASRAMRCLLIDHARARAAARRGGRHQPTSCDALDHIAVGIDFSRSLELDEALQRLAACDPRAAEVIDLRVFGGRSVEETAELLSVSASAIKNDYRFARAFLHRELCRE